MRIAPVHAIGAYCQGRVEGLRRLAYAIARYEAAGRGRERPQGVLDVMA